MRKRDTLRVGSLSVEKRQGSVAWGHQHVMIYIARCLQTEVRAAVEKVVIHSI